MGLWTTKRPIGCVITRHSVQMTTQGAREGGAEWVFVIVKRGGLIRGSLDREKWKGGPRWYRDFWRSLIGRVMFFNLERDRKQWDAVRVKCWDELMGEIMTRLIILLGLLQYAFL
ncbi:hypothetical protein CDAR_204801 [Caerostris darwini]|uniref:Uncharacterized protein n=1 Tax=Caerostris darwini TaxID=1538125 RepID=A0AAV4PFJ9_9ARAC|nr:hypothetical protein CDAR_204801 [Caerostris darwini]